MIRKEKVSIGVLIDLVCKQVGTVEPEDSSASSSVNQNQSQPPQGYHFSFGFWFLPLPFLCICLFSVHVKEYLESEHFHEICL